MMKKSMSVLTAGLAPSVRKISFGSAGNPSRSAIPAAMVSRNPLMPWFKGNATSEISYNTGST